MISWLVKMARMLAPLVLFAGGVATAGTGLSMIVGEHIHVTGLLGLALGFSGLAAMYCAVNWVDAHNREYWERTKGEEK